jgi:release factor glutamine methyltransferase
VDVSGAIGAVAERLTAAGSESPRLDAEILLRHVLGIDQTTLFMRLREPIDDGAHARFLELVEQRAAGMPIAYLTGEREFFGHRFAVGPGVLVPRPETEQLVEWAIRWLESRSDATVVDVGTGGGAIVLSVALALPEHAGRFIGADLSSAALAFAERNRHDLGLEQRVHLLRGDLLSWCTGGVDLLLANLPYLTPAQVAQNPEIHAEPELALISGNDGLDAIERLIADLPRVASREFAAIFELDPSQAARVAELLRGRWPHASVEIIKDLSGRERFVAVEVA